MRWLAGVELTGNYNGFNQNYALYRHMRTNRYRIIPWDYEGTWGRDSYGKYFGSNPVPITGHNELTRRLLSFRAIRREYAKKLSSILESNFTVNRIGPAVEQLILNYVKERREIVSRDVAKLL